MDDELVLGAVLVTTGAVDLPQSTLLPPSPLCGAGVDTVWRRIAERSGAHDLGHQDVNGKPAGEAAQP